MLLIGTIEMYVSSGLSLNSALDLLIPVFSKSQARAICEIRKKIISGKQLSSALVEHVRLSQTLANVIQQGEVSGNLPASLGVARSIMEREDALIKTCLSALTYPLVIGIFSLLVMIGLMKGVMPQIIPLLRGMHVHLPLITRACIYASDHIWAISAYVFAVPVIVYIPGSLIYRHWGAFAKIVHQILHHIPIVGKITYLFTLAIFFRLVGGLISTGTPSTHAYASVSSRVWSIPIREFFLSKISQLQGGARFATTVAGLKHIPHFVCPLVSAGESSGKLGSSMERIANMMDKDIENMLKRVSSLIEPIMMIGVGSMVGMVAASIMMPIYEVTKSLQH